MRKYLPLIFLTLLLITTRVLVAHDVYDLANLQPLGALFFCCAAFHLKRWLWIPAIAWMSTMAYTNSVQGYAWSWGVIGTVALGLFAIVTVGYFFQKKSSLAVIGGSLLAAASFYLITNSLSWWSEPLYAKTLGGFTQAMWTGIPGYPPTWMFFRNSLVSMGLFTSLFVAAQHSLALSRAPRGERIPQL